MDSHVYVYVHVNEFAAICIGTQSCALFAIPYLVAATSLQSRARRCHVVKQSRCVVCVHIYVDVHVLHVYVLYVCVYVHLCVYTYVHMQ